MYFLHFFLGLVRQLHFWLSILSWQALMCGTPYTGHDFSCFPSIVALIS